MSYKVKCFENNVKPFLDDDFALAVKFFKDKCNLDVVFERTQTNVGFYEKETKLGLVYDGSCDVIFYIFDRKSTNISVAKTIQFSDKTSLCWMPTGVEEDPIGYHWKTICHELIHSFAARLRTKGIYTLVDFEMDKYDQNDDPYSPNGNFSRALAILKPYLALLGANLTVEPRVELTRTKDDGKETLGILEAYNNNAKFTCKTLELPWKDNFTNISCIPKGTYQVLWKFMPSMLAYHYQIQNVKGRSGIYIHPANYFNQIKGCIALGSNLVDINGDGELDTANSRVTIKAFEDFMQRKPFTIKII